MVKTVLGGGSDLSPDMQKIVAKLEQLLKGGKKLDIGIDELKKKAGVFNVKNTTVSAYIRRKKKDGLFKNLSIKGIRSLSSSNPTTVELYFFFKLFKYCVIYFMA